MTRTQRRNLIAGIATLMALGLLTAAILLRLHAAPEPARLLPECNGILYANLKPLRTFTNLDRKPGAWGPEYRDFVRQTDFEFERDLDEVALAIHAPQDPSRETRYSEVIVGRFNSAKVNEFLARMATSRENYRDHAIFLIPYEDRVVRVTILSPDMVAVSNTGDRAQMNHMIDEFRRSVLASTGTRLLKKYYRDVPLGSLAWLITEVAPPKAISLGDNTGPVPFLRQIFGGGVVVASARYAGNILLRADTFLSGDAIQDRSEQLRNLLAFYRSTQEQTRPQHPDPDVEAALESLRVEQRSDRVEVTASVRRSLIEKLFETPIEEAGEQPRPPRSPQLPKGKHHQKP